MNLPRLESERLVIREPSPTDIPSMPAVFSDPDIYAHTRTIPYPYTEAAAAEAIERFARLSQTGEAQTFFIELKDTAELIGSVGTLNIEGRKQAEFGYAIGRKWWGKGYATEASRALLNYCFNDLGFRELCAHAMTRNPASSRVLQKLGMRSVGVIPGACEKDGVLHDAEGYTITRDQWLGSQPND